MKLAFAWVRSKFNSLQNRTSPELTAHSDHPISCHTLTRNAQAVATARAESRWNYSLQTPFAEMVLPFNGADIHRYGYSFALHSGRVGPCNLQAGYSYRITGMPGITYKSHRVRETKSA